MLFSKCKQILKYLMREALFHLAQVDLTQFTKFDCALELIYLVQHFLKPLPFVLINNIEASLVKSIYLTIKGS